MRLLAVLLAFSLPAQAQVQPADSRLQALQTGDDLRGFEAVGRLNMAGTGFCTATLIAPDRVLTAAHCLFDRATGQRIAESRLEFLAGWRTGRAEAIRSVTRAAIWPTFDMSAGAAISSVAEDLAVLHLDRPVRTTAIHPIALADAPVARGEAVTVVSYARDRAEAPAIQETCHVLEQRRDGVSVFSCDIDYGASGSPVLTRDGDALSIVSVISARVEGTEGPISLGMQLGGRVAALMTALDNDVSGTRAPGPQGARTTARFVRP